MNSMRGLSLHQRIVVILMTLYSPQDTSTSGFSFKNKICFQKEVFTLDNVLNDHEKKDIFVIQRIDKSYVIDKCSMTPM